MTTPKFLTLAALLSLAIAPGCAAENADPESGEEEETAPELDGRAAESTAVGVDCTNERSATGYKSGSAFSIKIVDADGKPIELATATSYARMQKAAAADGVHIRVVSGFRTMSEQQYLYNCYLSKRCNGGNLAAKPGYSNHQSGHALDLNTSGPGVYSWLAAHADEHGFRRTVPSEAWHWEYWGGVVGGSCVSTSSGGGGGGGSASGCYSSTLGRNVVENTCVQSRADRLWYQCVGGNRWEIRWGVAAKCVSEHPL